MEASRPPKRPTSAAGLVEPAAQASSAATADGGDEVRATSFLQRASLRRRLQYLLRRRELALRDLGGFVFESHRQGEQNPDLLAEKIGALSTIDDERELLERALGERQEIVVLREPGISVCPACSTLCGSDANYCPQCGTAVTGRAPQALGRKTAAG
jgi:hypothetical protein